MEPAHKIALLERALRMVEEGTTERGAADLVVDTERYRSPARYEREHRRILLRHPVIVAHRAELAAPGSFLTTSAAGLPLLVSRGHDGALRAFVNACRHRGTRLVWDERGQAARSFQCPYHAWTYAEDGRLVGVPGRECFDADAGADLIALPCGEAHGYVFVRPTPGPPDLGAELPAYLGAAAADLADYDAATAVVYRQSRRLAATNWKIILEGALEAYHVSVAHRGTIAPIFARNTMLFDDRPPHRRVLMVKRSLRELRKQPPETWRLREHLNAVHHLFPTALLLVNPDHEVLFTVDPDGPGAVRIEARMIIPEPPATPSAERHWAENWDYTMTALEEDFVIAERIYETLRAGAVETVRFGRHELGLAALHATIDGLLAEG